MTLDLVKKGSCFKILKIDDLQLRSHLIKLGIAEGSTLSCIGKIPFGPLILKNKMQEIALGRSVAREITVE